MDFIERYVNCPSCGCRFGLAEAEGEEAFGDVKIIRKSIDRISWDGLAESIAIGEGARVISVGDKIPVELKNGEKISLVAVHANPYWENSMAFSFEDCLNDEHDMNSSGRYNNGYETCDMRKYITKEVFKLLPDELAAVIQPRTIQQKPYDGQMHQFTDKLWLLSQVEVFGLEREEYRGIDIGDIQFDYFKIQKNRIKTLRGQPYWYWLRTPSASDGSIVRFVNTDGSLNSSYAYDSYGVAPACVIGAPEPKWE